MLLPWSCWSLHLLCTTAQLWWWPGFGIPMEELENPTEEPGTLLELEVPKNVPLEVTMGDKRFQAEAALWELSPWNFSHRQEHPPGRLQPGLEPPRQQLLALGENPITRRQRQVVQLREDITHLLGNVSGRGAAEIRESHQVILFDLHHSQERAREVYSQIERNLAILLAQQHRLEEVMEKLWQINQSLGLALGAVESAWNHVENHLQHLQAVQEPAGQSPSVISTYILHGSYFVLLVVLLVPTLPHAILLLFLASSAFGKLLGIPALFTLLVLAVAGKWFSVSTHHGAKGAWLVPLEKPRPWLTSTPERDHDMELLQEELDRLEMSCLQEPSCLEQPPVMARDVPNLAGQVSPIRGGWRAKLSCGEMLEVPTASGKHWEPKLRSRSRSLASDVSLRAPCRGLTRARQPCRKKAIPGQDFCHVHTPS